MIPQVSIILLCHNDQACLEDCAASLNRHTPKGSCELIIVDNGSRREARPAMDRVKRKSVFPAKILRNRENRFFGPANNQGLAASRSPYVLFLNADTIVTPGWLPALTEGLRSDPRLGMVGPMTNSAVGFQLVNGAPREPRQLRAWLPGWRRRQPAGVRLVPWIIGFCALMPRPLAAALGGFDELYGPGGYEDYDLCLKTRLAGYEVGVVSGCYVHHLGGMGYSGMRYDEMRKSNREIYRGKWCGLLRKELEARL